MVPKRTESTQPFTYQQAIENVPETRISKLDTDFRIASEDTGLPTATVRYIIRLVNRKFIKGHLLVSVELLRNLSRNLDETKIIG